MSVQVGDRIRYTAQFTSVTGVPTNTTVNVRVQNPDGDEVAQGSVPANNGNTGQYDWTQTFDREGPWVIRFVGTGAIVAALEYTEVVDQSAFATLGS